MKRLPASILVLSFLTIIGVSVGYGQGTPPTISHIPDQVTQKNLSTGPIPFTVGDPDTNLDSLFVTALSRDTSLIPDANLVLGGSGADRTITITPALDATGTDSIVVSVSDGVGSVSDTFRIKVNDPPRLDFNQPLELNEGTTATITSSFLHAVDTDGPDAQITFTVNPDTLGQDALHGTVLLNNVPISSGDSFTQEDINNGLVAYHHDGSETTSDFFTFGVEDGDGGITSDAGFSIFHFNVVIDLVNDAPTPHDTSYSIGLGQVLNAQLSATDPDSPSLTFSITANGTLGSVMLGDSTTGAFTYTPNSGVSGVDSFFFQVYDGTIFATTPGRVIVTIEEQPPSAFDGAGVAREGIPFTDTLRATDPDLPPEVLHFSVVTGAQKGAVVITDSTAGIFTYTPQPAFFGVDSFTFQANDGVYTSSPAKFRITVRPNLDPGDILVADNKYKGILLIDPSTGDQFAISSGDSLKSPRDVVMEPDGNLVVLDAVTGLVRVDPTTGKQTMLTVGPVFTTGPLGPTNMTLEHDGNILVADGTAGIKRVNPVDGTVTTVTSGDSINLAIGVAVASNGDIIVGDGSKFIGQNSRIMRVNPATGEQHTIVSSGTIFLPIGIALDGSDQIYVSDPASFVGAPQDFLYGIDPTTGTQTLIVTSETLHIPIGLDFDNGGKLVATNNQAPVLYEIDPANGTATAISSGGYFMQQFGLTIVRPHALFSISDAKLHFGGVGVGTSVQDSLIVSNPGSATLYITSVTSDSSQFVVSPTSGAVSAGSAMTFYVTFHPNSTDTVFSGIAFTHSASLVPFIVQASGSGIVTGVKDRDPEVPKQFALYNNFPNPFNPTTTLRFDVPRQSVITVKVYSILGAEAGTIVDHRQYDPGSYSLKLDASGYSSGVYFYEIVAESREHGERLFRSVKKMVLVR